jgi:hypothetical protein
MTFQFILFRVFNNFPIHFISCVPYAALTVMQLLLVLICHRCGVLVAACEILAESECRRTPSCGFV